MGKKYTKTQLGIYFCSLAVLLAAVITRKGDTGMATIGVVAALLLFMFERSAARIQEGVEGEGLTKMKRMQMTYRFVVGIVMVGLAGASWLPAFKDSIPHAEKIFRVALTGAVMLFIGKAAPRLPFENGIGLRFAWAKEDEAVWKVAHNVLSRITIPIVALLVIGGIFFHQDLLILYCILFWVGIPGFVSWKFSKVVAVKRQQAAKQKAEQETTKSTEETAGVSETPKEETEKTEADVIVVSDEEMTIED